MNRDVVFVLLLVQAAAGLLASVGELVVMGSPLYLAAPLLKAVAIMVIAGRVARGRRWALVAAVVAQWLGLLGLWFGLALGVLPGLDPTLTMVGLLTEVALPVAVIVLCAQLLAARPHAAAPRSGGPHAIGPDGTLVVAR